MSVTSFWRYFCSVHSRHGLPEETSPKTSVQGRFKTSVDGKSLFLSTLVDPDAAAAF